MNTVRRRVATALTAAIALAIGGIPAAFTTSSILAAGEGSTTLASANVPVGKLTLSTNSSQGTVSWNGITETFTGGQQCKIEWANEPTLLELTGSQTDGDPAVAGFREGDIGVFEPALDGSPTNASQCFRVDGDSFDLAEVLNVSLGSNPALVEQFGNTESPILIGGVNITYAVTSKSGTFTVKGNDGAVNLGTVKWPATKQQKVSPGDVLSATISLPANTLISSFSLTPDLGTSFSLRTAELDLTSQADAVINCTDKNTYAEVGTGVSVTYSGTADGSPCQSFGITLDTDASDVTTFHKPLTVDPDAQFIFVKPWDAKAATSANELPIAQIDFEIPGRTEPVWRDMDFCPDYLYVDGKIKGLLPSTYIGGTDNGTYKENYADLKSRDMEKPDDGATEIPANAGIQFGCIGARTPTFTKAASGFNVQVTDTLYVIGDLRFSSP